MLIWFIKYEAAPLPVSDGVGGPILVDYQYRVHARVHLLLIGLGEWFAIWSNSQSVWNSDRHT